MGLAFRGRRRLASLRAVCSTRWGAESAWKSSQTRHHQESLCAAPLGLQPRERAVIEVHALGLLLLAVSVDKVCFQIGVHLEDHFVAVALTTADSLMKVVARITTVAAMTIAAPMTAATPMTSSLPRCFLACCHA